MDVLGNLLWGSERQMRTPVMMVGLLFLALLLAGTAQADNGPHGGYTAVTDSCAGCHRSHSATAAKLLTNTNTALCLTCHGPAAAGAYTNVVDGVYDAGGGQGTAGAGLNGGGFANAVQNTSLTTPLSGTVTSRHSVQATADYSTTATLWGAGAIGSGAGLSFDLYCTSCHDPHGSPNYRMIKTTVNGMAVTLSRTDEVTKSYTTATYYKPAPGAGRWEISSFCAACHTRYLATGSGSGEIPSTDAIFSFRHRVDVTSTTTLNGITYTFPSGMVLPVSSTGGPPSTSPDNRVMVCLTCHYAHGTKATMGTNSGSVPLPGTSAAPPPGTRSALLRLDNRGVCENCHNK